MAPPKISESSSLMLPFDGVLPTPALTMAGIRRRVVQLFGLSVSKESQGLQGTTELNLSKSRPRAFILRLPDTSSFPNPPQNQPDFGWRSKK
jgi:hypothetical protein